MFVPAILKNILGGLQPPTGFDARHDVTSCTLHSMRKALQDIRQA